MLKELVQIGNDNNIPNFRIFVEPRVWSEEMETKSRNNFNQLKDNVKPSRSSNSNNKPPINPAPNHLQGE